MSTDLVAVPNVKRAVPFFNVTDIEASLRFYIDGLGFVLTNKWEPEGRVRWCWLQLGDAALMLQEYWRDGHQAGAPDGPLGQGVAICFMLRRTSVEDADGYRLDFESPTNAPEETIYAG